MLAAIDGELGRQAPVLLEELELLRLNARDLMLESYTSLSTENELDLQYRFFEEFLRGAFVCIHMENDFKRLK